MSSSDTKQGGGYVLSPEINERGDRILVPGEPGALERLVQAKNTVMRAEARERVRTFLEKDLPSVVECLGDEDLGLLIDGITSLCWQTAGGYLDQAMDAVRAAMRHVPPYRAIPDPLDRGNQLVEMPHVMECDPSVVDVG